MPTKTKADLQDEIDDLHALLRDCQRSLMLLERDPNHAKGGRRRRWYEQNVKPLRERITAVLEG